MKDQIHYFWPTEFLQAVSDAPKQCWDIILTRTFEVSLGEVLDRP